MEQINVSVGAAGQTAEYYDLITVRRMLDEMQAEIGRIGEATIVEKTAGTTDIEMQEGIIYVWPAAPQFINATLSAPADTSKKSEYALAFLAGSGFRLSLSAADGSPVVVQPAAGLVEGYNRVNITYMRGTFYATINNYRE